MAEQHHIMPVENQWRTPQFRQKVVGQIEDAMRQSGHPMTKSSNEMEDHVFQKAKSREEYLALVARLIIHVREINSKKNAGMQGAGIGVASGPGMGPQGQPNIQDPINALQNLTRQGPTSNIPGQPGQPQVGMPGQQMGMQPQQPQQQQRPPFQSYQQNMGGPQAMGMAPQQQLPPGMAPGVRQDMFMAQQFGGMQGQMVQQGQPMPGQQQTIMVSSMSDMSSMQQQPQMMMQAGMGMHPQQQQQQRFPQAQPGFMQPQPMSAGAPIPSPLQAVGLPVHSPASLMPAPSPQGITPSGGGMAASPGGSVSLNTPIQMQVTPGTAGGGGAGGASGDTEYLEKLKQLQAYTEPLKRMINRMEKDEDRKRPDSHKMKGLLDILTDSKRQVSMQTLLKCEQVLRQNFRLDEATQSSMTPGSHITTKQDILCTHQLFESIASQIKSPMLNHTLQRTFGPAIRALHGTPSGSGSPPTKQRRRNEDDVKKDGELPVVLQGELARLHHRFSVKLHPLYHLGSSTVHLLCKLDDCNLPSVPPLSVTIPENYPNNSPTCETSNIEYESTPFLQRVQQLLSSQLLQLPDRFSVSALLDTWEMSVRKACAPNSA